MPPLGVRISTDKGDTYTEILALSDVAYTSSCQVGQTIFLGGFGGSIARSDDNGQNWRLSNFGTVFPSGVEITDCYGLEFFKGKLFASGFGAGIAYSDDMGETWKNTDVSALVALDEEEVSATPDMRIVLKSESQQLQEVVVTGMVATDKRLFTGPSLA